MPNRTTVATLEEVVICPNCHCHWQGSGSLARHYRYNLECQTYACEHADPSDFLDLGGVLILKSTLHMDTVDLAGSRCVVGAISLTTGYVELRFGKRKECQLYLANLIGKRNRRP